MISFRCTHYSVATTFKRRRPVVHQWCRGHAARARVGNCSRRPSNDGNRVSRCAPNAVQRLHRTKPTISVSSLFAQFKHYRFCKFGYRAWSRTFAVGQDDSWLLPLSLALICFLSGRGYCCALIEPAITDNNHLLKCRQHVWYQSATVLSRSMLCVLLKRCYSVYCLIRKLGHKIMIQNFFAPGHRCVFSSYRDTLSMNATIFPIMWVNEVSHSQNTCLSVRFLTFALSVSVQNAKPLDVTSQFCRCFCREFWLMCCCCVLAALIGSGQNDWQVTENSR